MLKVNEPKQTDSDEFKMPPYAGRMHQPVRTDEKRMRPPPIDGHSHHWKHLHGQVWSCAVCFEFTFFPVDYPKAVQFSMATNRYGWKTAHRLYLEKHPELAKLLNRLNKAVDEEYRLNPPTLSEQLVRKYLV